MNKAINHRNVRLLLVLIFSIITFSFCFGHSNLKTFVAEPADIPVVVAESKTVHRGQTFSVDVDLSQNEGLISLFLTLDYDDSVMTLKNVIQGSALGSLTFTTTNVETEYGYGIKPFNMLWDGREADRTNGTIVTLIFDSNIDAPIGEYTITLTYDRENTNTAYQTPTDISITNGIINLITGEYQAIYRNFDGEILYQKDYNADDIPAYPSNLPNPTREEDAEYSYEFVGWKGVISDDINVLIFEADYRFIPQVYTVFFYVDGINGYPDNIIDENDYFDAIELDFGAVIETPRVPERQYYEFLGWYLDESFETTLTFGTMPARNLRLYGYYSFDVRDRDIPIISLEDVELNDNLEDVVITAKILKNTGFNGLVLTLKYDKDVLTFDHFERLDVLSSMQFDTTNTADLSVDNFKFYFESATNNYELGSFLKLYFKIKPNVENGTHIVSFDYDYHTDATYINQDGEIKYTMIEFYDGEVPVGEINHWWKEFNSERKVDITSEDGKPINVYIEIELVTDEINLDEELIEEEVGRGMRISSAYKIRMMQNRKEIQPNTTLTIRIKLTETEQKGKTEFYYLNDDNELISHDFKIEDGELVFTTDHLSNWVIFNNYNENSHKSNLAFLIGMPIILTIATMLYALRLRQLNTKIKKEAHND
ncbi:MAG: InlB B-repeat-containing protein [Clostridia bacterium]|nr:InlB B-repeat-containing protein [Clostridia bacterium]